jgi:hypothetical protein
VSPIRTHLLVHCCAGLALYVVEALFPIYIARQT